MTPKMPRFEERHQILPPSAWVEEVQQCADNQSWPVSCLPDIKTYQFQGPPTPGFEKNRSGMFLCEIEREFLGNLINSN